MFMKVLKTLILFLAALLPMKISALGVWDGTSEIWTKGDGTEKNPYQIETPQQLAFVAEMVNGNVSTYEGIYFKQMDDFDLNELQWTPIGVAYSFMGNYDGNDKEIKGLLMLEGGVWGTVQNSTIKNLTLITNTNTSSQFRADIVGCLVGTFTNCHIENINVIGDISIKCDNKTLSSFIFGGIVGKTVGSADIKGCSVDLTFSIAIDEKSVNLSAGDLESYCYLGGLIGRAAVSGSNTTIQNCKSKFNSSFRFNGKYTSRLGFDIRSLTLITSGICSHNSQTAMSITKCKVEGQRTLNIVGRTEDGKTRLKLNAYDGDAIGFLDCGYNNITITNSMFESFVSRDVDVVDEHGDDYDFMNNKEYAVGSVIGKYYTNSLGKTEIRNVAIRCYHTLVVGMTFGVFQVPENAIIITNSYQNIQSNLNYHWDNEGTKTTKTLAQLQSSSFPIILNVDSTVFVQDKSPYVNNGCPIIKGMPAVGTLDATEVGSKVAVLNGIHKEAMNVKEVGFEYSANGSTTKVACSQKDTPFSLKVIGLTSETEYEYRPYIIVDGITYWGKKSTFTTLEDCGTKKFTIKDSICDGQTYTFGSVSIDKTGVYMDTMYTDMGCDSIIELSLNVLPSYDISTSSIISKGESYDFYGEKLTNSGTYTKYVSSVKGCNFVTLDLTVLDGTQANVVVESNDNNMGTVAGGGIYTIGEEVTITAEASNGYYFIMWNDSSTSNPRTIVVSENNQYNAIFSAKYNVKVSSSDLCMGSVYGGGLVEAGKNTKIAATAKKGYEFVGWSDGDANRIRTISVTQDSNIVAVFSAKLFLVKLNCDEEKGIVIGDGEYKYGEKATIIAIPFDEYAFDQWSDSSLETERTIIVTGNISLNADFKSIEKTDITLCSNDELSIYTDELNIIIDTNNEIYVKVYNALSQLIYEGYDYMIKVPSTGVYLVEIDDEIVKVIVK